MKNTFLKTIGGAALAILTLAIFAQVWVSAQGSINGRQNQELIQDNERGGARALEGSWSVQVTIRNCQTGAAITSFPAMDTFIQGGTMQEYSAGSGILRGPGHGVWNYEFGRQFDYAFQFFRFNADGTLAGVTKARRQLALTSDNSYAGNALIEIFNASGVLVATACATETATRFE
jgi:hypothetical protein